MMMGDSKPRSKSWLESDLQLEITDTEPCLARRDRPSLPEPSSSCDLHSLPQPLCTGPPPWREVPEECRMAEFLNYFLGYGNYCIIVGV